MDLGLGLSRQNLNELQAATGLYHLSVDNLGIAFLPSPAEFHPFFQWPLLPTEIASSFTFAPLSPATDEYLHGLRLENDINQEPLLAFAAESVSPVPISCSWVECSPGPSPPISPILSDSFRWDPTLTLKKLPVLKAKN